MNRVYWVLPVLLVIAIGLGWAISNQGDTGNVTPINGNDNPPESPPDGNPIYYYFYSDTCPSCKEMERTLSNSSVMEILEANFTYISVNTGKERQLAQSYNIIYVPTNLFAYPGGQEIGRAVGAADPENFLKMLDQVLEFYAQNG